MNETPPLEHQFNLYERCNCRGAEHGLRVLWTIKNEEAMRYVWQTVCSIELVYCGSLAVNGRRLCYGK
jgi:hypothetical protein